MKHNQRQCLISMIEAVIAGTAQLSCPNWFPSLQVDLGAVCFQSCSNDDLLSTVEMLLSLLVGGESSPPDVDESNEASHYIKLDVEWGLPLNRWKGDSED